MNKTDRIGERNYNTFGSEMVIIDYRKYSDIDVYFPEYDYIVKSVQYGHFTNGKIKCPYERRYYYVGYIGEGNYKVSENRKIARVYSTWYEMLQRCYDEKLHEKRPTYKDCEVDEEWLNFQNFAEWYENNYYEIEGERMCLDKDILIKHNKIYSSQTCVFVPNTINTLFTKRDNKRGDSLIGTSSTKNGKYKVCCNLFNLETGESKREYLGLYDTQEKAFEIYKYYKEKNIKDIADYYKGQIPQKLYDALYNYKVEITD
nr:MAG TPA: hypothetical protein [Caudoviricetes sp.]